eukprot:SAG31_NODE_467_length_15267_cov_13.792919_3_plen_106_part_00
MASDDLRPLTQGDTFSISALHLAIKVPCFSNSRHKNEKVTPYLACHAAEKRWAHSTTSGLSPCAAPNSKQREHRKYWEKMHRAVGIAECRPGQRAESKSRGQQKY